MSYKNQTNFYRIPYMAHGDMLTEQSERTQMTIIDNLLYAATFGASKCIIEDGKYSLQKMQNADLYRVVVSPYYDRYSAIGILNYRLYLKQGKYYSPYFKKGSYYYVYISYSSKLQINPESFQVQIKLSQVDDDNDIYIKICEVDFTGQTPILIEDVNKVLAKNVLAHTQDFTNPHGQILVQKELNVTNELKIKQNIVYPTIYEKIKSGGVEGVVWQKQGCVPIFVTIYGEQNLGQIVWKIENEKLIIKNNGQKDINMNIKVQVQYNGN